MNQQPHNDVGMSKPRQPKSVTVDDLRAVPHRPPTKRDPRWSWRCRKAGDLLFSGRFTRAQVRRKLLEAALAEPDDEPAEPLVEHVSQVMDLWFTNEVMGRRDERSTERMYRTNARRVVRLIGELRIDRGRWVLDELHRQMERAGYKHGTRSVTQVTLLVAWRWAYGRDLVQTAAPPAKRMKREKPAPRNVPTVDQALAVLDEVRRPWRTALLIQLATGARISEVCALRVEDVEDGARPVLHLGRHADARKTGERAVPVTMPAAVRAIRAAMAEAQLAGRGTVLAGNTGAQIRMRAVHKALAGVDWVALDVPKFTTHGLRYLAVKMLRQAGVDVETAAALLGHSVTMMLKTYRQVDASEKVEAMERARLGETGGVRGIVR